MTTRGVHPTPDHVSPTWILREEGHCIAKIGDVTLGHVVSAPDGSFIAFDRLGTPLGRHDSLRAAQLSTLHAAELPRLHAADTAEIPTTVSRFGSAVAIVAIVAGALAATLLTAGIVVLSIAR